MYYSKNSYQTSLKTATHESIDVHAIAKIYIKNYVWSASKEDGAVSHQQFVFYNAMYLKEIW